jgi:L-asparaginase II
MSEIKENIQQPAPLVTVRRGPIVESRHHGHIAIVDGDGRLIAELGAPETVTYLRSSAKPHQAIPLIVSGAANAYGFTERELAIVCASHNGESIHTDTVAAMLCKIGLDANALRCGVHEPFSREVAQNLRAEGARPNILQNNCSGKHTGMLALAKFLNAPVETYDQPDNPVQRKILHTIAQFSATPVESINIGIDGCGAPTFAISIRAMATMYARLVAPPKDFDEHVRAACERIISAMTKYPEMIGGTSERLDTEVMRTCGHHLISKVGAEGVYTAGVRPSEMWPRGLGIALKIEDGEDRRARPTVAIETLRQLCVLDETALQALAPYARFALRNHRGDTVGEVRADFQLQRTTCF